VAVASAGQYANLQCTLTRHITMPASHHSVLQARCPSCCPTNSIKALKAVQYVFGILTSVLTNSQKDCIANGRRSFAILVMQIVTPCITPCGSKCTHLLQALSMQIVHTSGGMLQQDGTCPLPPQKSAPFIWGSEAHLIQGYCSPHESDVKIGS